MKSAGRTWEEAVKSFREQPEMLGFVRDCYYDDPLFNAAERFYNSIEWNAVQQLFKQYNVKIGNAADIGAGRGIASYALARDGFSVTAFEPDQSKLVGTGAIESLSREAGLPISILHTYGETLDVSDSTFDFVYLRAVLHHAKDMKKFCSEIGRILHDNSFLFVTREHVISHKSDKETFLEGHPLHHLYGGENAYLLKEYLNALNSGGLKVIKVLYPYDSPINLFPRTMNDLIQKLKKKIPLPAYLCEILIKAYSRVNIYPGALFSFVCKKVGT